MRFQVNETLPVLAIIYANVPANANLMFHAYYPWRNDVIDRIEFDHLTVAEHHKVNQEYDEAGAEPSCDGYLLQSSKGEAWSNQYPTAHYGQWSDSANRLFTRYFSGDKEAWREWYANNPNVPCQYRLLSDYLADVKRGIQDRNEESGLTEADIAMTAVLQKHLDAVVAQYEEESGKVVVFEKTRWGFWEVSFADKTESAA